MSRHQPSSQNHDGGTARARSRRRSQSTLATVIPKPVLKTYTGRPPVSGAQPARLTKYEREKLERRAG